MNVENEYQIVIRLQSMSEASEFLQQLELIPVKKLKQGTEDVRK